VVKRGIFLLLLILASTSLTAETSPTVVVFDLSYSMSLPHTQTQSRKDALLAALSEQIDPEERNYALILFQDSDEVNLALPYPATGRRVIEEIESTETWGRSPILAATEFALRVAKPLPQAGVLVVTDGEDDSWYLHPRQTASRPETLDSVTLSLLTMSRTAPGVSGELVAWAEQSGGEITELRRGMASGRMVAGPGTSAAVSDHELETRAEVHGRERGGAWRSFLSASLLVARWILLAAFAGALLSLYVALRRGRKRREDARSHNEHLTTLTLGVRSTDQRFEETFTGFPVSVGSSPENSLHLSLPNGPNASFTLQPTAGGLAFHATGKLNVNGVGRTEWTVGEGDHIRVGKYRVSIERFVQRDPLSIPPPITWQQPALAAVSLVLALGAFLLYPLVSSATPASAAGGSERGANEAQHNLSERAPLSVTPTPQGGFRPTLPAVLTRDDHARYFDADYLLIHAHPDDETLDNGVLLSRLNAAGLTGAVVLLTDGQSGIDQYPEREVGGLYTEYDLSGDDLVAVRVTEARRALGYLGVPVYIRGQLQNHPYNSVTDQLTPAQVLSRWGGTENVAQALAEVIQAFTPELLISPDGPAGPYEHFEHEATGLVVRRARDTALRNGVELKAHIMAIDPLQKQHYDRLLEVSPWDTHPESGMPFRWHQLMALLQHKTQRDASSVGIETRLAVSAEFYAVQMWAPGFSLPPLVGIENPVSSTSHMTASGVSRAASRP
jgi:LmbE family N-acetylglucosaminyl deacetylase